LEKNTPVLVLKPGDITDPKSLETIANVFQLNSHWSALSTDKFVANDSLTNFKQIPHRLGANVNPNLSRSVLYVTGLTTVMHVKGSTESGKTGNLPNKKINDEFGTAATCAFFECPYKQTWNEQDDCYESQCKKQNNTVKAHLYMLTETGRKWLNTLAELHDQAQK
jgi:hypothetical protein